MHPKSILLGLLSLLAAAPAPSQQAPAPGSGMLSKCDRACLLDYCRPICGFNPTNMDCYNPCWDDCIWSCQQPGNCEYGGTCKEKGMLLAAVTILPE
ncbi:hypothetical protein B0T17DRAFT_528200 [Bombardia bombarda]|uniref:Uncharacterized protein n=1 Tax=Bombardia bombarda TaxID=252184 RepID=A0AA39XAI8_9PEZI|nr:hypothetical protein B0T17DRAFT_528200 [Bombardia bombarda]